MTTVVADLREGVMVSDSKVSVEHKGIDYPAIKIVKKGGMLIGAAGFAGDCTRFIKWAASKFNDAEPKWDDRKGDDADSMIGIILKDDGIYLWNHGDPEPERVEAEFYAIGSGGKAARAAMLMGANAEKAVEVACQVDPASSLPLQVLRLKNG